MCNTFRTCLWYNSGNTCLCLSKPFQGWQRSSSRSTLKWTDSNIGKRFLFTDLFLGFEACFCGINESLPGQLLQFKITVIDGLYFHVGRWELGVYKHVICMAPWYVCLNGTYLGFCHPSLVWRKCDSSADGGWGWLWSNSTKLFGCVWNMAKKCSFCFVFHNNIISNAGNIFQFPEIYYFHFLISIPIFQSFLKFCSLDTILLCFQLQAGLEMIMIVEDNRVFGSIYPKQQWKVAWCVRVLIVQLIKNHGGPEINMRQRYGRSKYCQAEIVE